MEQHTYYIQALGVTAFRFAVSGRRVRLGRAATLTEAEAAELRSCPNVRGVERAKPGVVPEAKAPVSPATKVAPLVAMAPRQFFRGVVPSTNGGKAAAKGGTKGGGKPDVAPTPSPSEPAPAQPDPKTDEPTNGED